MRRDETRLLLAGLMRIAFVFALLWRSVLPLPRTTGVSVPLMHRRAVPLQNCSYAAFSIYLRADHQIGGGSYNDWVERSEMLQRVRTAQGDVPDNTYYFIADHSVSWQEAAQVLTDVANNAGATPVAIVTPAGQAIAHLEGHDERWVDRCNWTWQVEDWLEEKMIL